MNDYNSSVAYGAAAASGNPPAMAIVIIILVALLFYCYVAYSLMTIAKKTGTANAWLAWIPIANLLLLLMIIKKPLWWFVLMIIPLVNIVMAVIVWMKVAEAVGKPSWVGVLTIVPLVNIFVPGYLAFSSSAPATPTQPMPPAAPSV